MGTNVRLGCGEDMLRMLGMERILDRKIDHISAAEPLTSLILHPSFNCNEDSWTILEFASHEYGAHNQVSNGRKRQEVSLTLAEVLNIATAMRFPVFPDISHSSTGINDPKRQLGHTEIPASKGIWPPNIPAH